MNTIRTRFGKDIVGEFLEPARKTKKQRLIIIASGAPSSPAKGQLLEFFSKKGFYAIHFRYRGSWESSGKFLEKSHDLDILEVINQLPKGLKDSWTQKTYRIKPEQIIVVAGSFGGAAGILASRDKRISKVFAVSPLIDQTRPGKDEPFPKMIRFFQEGYGDAFRIAKDGWKKLQSGKFFNPIQHAKEIDGTKILIVHAKDDKSCPYSITKRFSEDIGAKLISLPKGDHLGNSIVMLPRFYKAFEKFIKQ